MSTEQWEFVRPTVEMLPVRFDGRTVGLLTVETVGHRDEWEMHPDQDELLFALSGAIEVHLRRNLNESDHDVLMVAAGQACVVPKRTWHHQVVLEPCKVLFVTPETLHEPYRP